MRFPPVFLGRDNHFPKILVESSMSRSSEPKQHLQKKKKSLPASFLPSFAFIIIFFLSFNNLLSVPSYYMYHRMQKKNIRACIFFARVLVARSSFFFCSIYICIFFVSTHHIQSSTMLWYIERKKFLMKEKKLEMNFQVVKGCGELWPGPIFVHKRKYLSSSLYVFFWRSEFPTWFYFHMFIIRFTHESSI